MFKNSCLLQNPTDCENAKKLVCNLNKACGYGCQLHHLTYCFMVAFGTQRTLIIESNGWRYNSEGWDAVFLPASENCLKNKVKTVTWRGWCAVADYYQLLGKPITQPTFYTFSLRLRSFAVIRHLAVADGTSICDTNCDVE